MSTASYDPEHELRARLREECPSRRVEPHWAPVTRGAGEQLAAEVSRRELSTRPWALLVDDGELEDVRVALEELGCAVERLDSRSAAQRGWRQPRRLLVVSGARALTLGRPVAQEGDDFTTVAVLDRPASSVRRGVAAMGFDIAIERPLDPDALRVLLQRALFCGREKRDEPRFTLGWTVRVRSGWRWGRANLIELSRRGGCLVSDAPLAAGDRVSVRLPAELAGAEPLTLHGRVSRAERRAPDGPSVLAVRWSGHPAPRLADVLARLRHGPPPPP